MFRHGITLGMLGLCLVSSSLTAAELTDYEKAERLGAVV